MKFEEIIKAMEEKNYKLFISLFKKLSLNLQQLKNFEKNEELKEKLIYFILPMYLKGNDEYNNFIREHKILFLALDHWHSYLKSSRMPAGIGDYSHNREKRYRHGKCGSGQCFSWW